MACTDLEKRSQLNHYYQRKALYVQALGGKCVKCGSTEKLEFDHIDPQTKNFSIGRAARLELTKVLEELKYCQLLCRSCHIEKTLDENGRAYHGSLGMYSHNKCRCDKCREAWNKNSNEYRRELRKKKKFAQMM